MVGLSRTHLLDAYMQKLEAEPQRAQLLSRSSRTHWRASSMSWTPWAPSAASSTKQVERGKPLSQSRQLLNRSHVGLQLVCAAGSATRPREGQFAWLRRWMREADAAQAALAAARAAWDALMTAARSVHAAVDAAGDVSRPVVDAHAGVAAAAAELCGAL
jgi:hypothetical protein